MTKCEPRPVPRSHSRCASDHAPSNRPGGHRGGHNALERPARAHDSAAMTILKTDISRRRLLRLLVSAPFASVLAMELLAPDEATAADALLAATASGRNQTPTPECSDTDEPTPAETAGPFFKPRSPERGSLLEPDAKGMRLELSGRVFGRDCRPLAGALLDFWQADGDGLYDNDGFRLRGHQYAD